MSETDVYEVNRSIVAAMRVVLVLLVIVLSGLIAHRQAQLPTRVVEEGSVGLVMRPMTDKFEQKYQVLDTLEPGVHQHPEKKFRVYEIRSGRYESLFRTLIVKGLGVDNVRKPMVPNLSSESEVADFEIDPVFFEGKITYSIDKDQLLKGTDIEITLADTLLSELNDAASFEIKHSPYISGFEEKINERLAANGGAHKLQVEVSTLVKLKDVKDPLAADLGVKLTLPEAQKGTPIFLWDRFIAAFFIWLLIGIVGIGFLVANRRL